jgi:iduronate 2-sulfatase
VPFIVAAPGFKKNTSSGRTVELLDIYPTLAELASLKSEGTEGKSLVALLKDPRATWDKPAYTQVRRNTIMGRSVRTERWRYTEWDNGSAGIELYDHEKDPKEFTNLATDPAYSERVKELSALLKKNRV